MYVKTLTQIPLPHPGATQPNLLTTPTNPEATITSPYGSLPIPKLSLLHVILPLLSTANVGPM
jgi:hypothetical protein